jgi:hypothetical protein
LRRADEQPRGWRQLEQLEWVGQRQRELGQRLQLGIRFVVVWIGIGLRFFERREPRLRDVLDADLPG